MYSIYIYIYLINKNNQTTYIIDRIVSATGVTGDRARAHTQTMHEKQLNDKIANNKILTKFELFENTLKPILSCMEPIMFDANKKLQQTFEKLKEKMRNENDIGFIKACDMANKILLNDNDNITTFENDNICFL